MTFFPNYNWLKFFRGNLVSAANRTSRRCRSCKESSLRAPERKPGPWILIEAEAWWRTRATELTPVDIKISLLFLTGGVSPRLFFPPPPPFRYRTPHAWLDLSQSIRVILITCVIIILISFYREFWQVISQLLTCALIFQKYEFETFLS